MEPDIREALSEIRADVRTGFDKVNKRIDSLISRGEFKATVQRIDAQHETLRRDHDNLDRTAKHEHAGIRDEMHKGLDSFSTQARWAVGIAVSIVSVVFGIITWVANTF